MFSRSILAAYRLWIRLRSSAFTQLTRGGFYRFGHKSTLQLPIRLAGEKHIEIGSGVFVGPNCWMQVMTQAGLKSDSPALTIGNGTGIAGFCTITVAKRIVIEQKVLIARYVYISDHSHEYRSNTVPIIDQGITPPRQITIREGAWIGQAVVVCPGVTIGRGSVIGANSVVRQDIPDYSLAAGTPARVIREITPKEVPC